MILHEMRYHDITLLASEIQPPMMYHYSILQKMVTYTRTHTLTNQWSFFCGRSMRHTWFHSRLIRLYTAQKVRRNANFAISSDNIFFEKPIWYALKCRFLAWLSCALPKKWEGKRVLLLSKKISKMNSTLEGHILCTSWKMKRTIPRDSELFWKLCPLYFLK